jgi:hypothetical protein
MVGKNMLNLNYFIKISLALIKKTKNNKKIQRN